MASLIKQPSRESLTSLLEKPIDSLVWGWDRPNSSEDIDS